MARPSLHIIAHYNLLASLIFGGDVVWCKLRKSVLAAPRQSREEASGGIRDGPFGRAEVAQEAFTGKPHAFGGSYGFDRGFGGGGCGDGRP